jgi:hypothetical protein
MDGDLQSCLVIGADVTGPREALNGPQTRPGNSSGKRGLSVLRPRSGYIKPENLYYTGEVILPVELRRMCTVSKALMKTTSLGWLEHIYMFVSIESSSNKDKFAYNTTLPDLSM